MIERLKTITELPVDKILISERLRDVRGDGVETLKEAIRERGFVGRIVVRRAKNGDFVLDGAHRLTAMRELGEPVIPCDVVRCSDDEALMFELDGNLAGAKMTALELSYFLARRRETYQRMNPSARRGYAATASRMGQTEPNSLCKMVAQERNLTERQVYKIMAAGAFLSEEEYRRLGKAPTQASLNDLQHIAKIGELDERQFVIDALVAGKAPKAAAARKLWKAEQGMAPEPLTNTDQTLLRLMDAWKRAPKIARRRFLEEKGGELQALLDEMRDD